jgi:hypothetical protein
MGKTTTTEGRTQALAWIRRQLAWERTLADLRDASDERPEESRQAA